MTRHLLDQARLHPAIRERVSTHHRDIVDEVLAAVAANALVVVGMKGNPHVRRVRKTLEAKAVRFKYLEYGSYFSDWRRRTALKMWTGWPTFPMVFHQGVLIGGADETLALLQSGELT